jgi:hypothetical protein
MNLELPDNARVRIFIAPMGYLLPPEGASIPSVPPAARPRRRLLKGAALLTLLGAAFLLGGHSLPWAGALQARAQSQGTRPPADDPDPPRPPEVPPAFARQLRQAPTVTPAPGAAASDATPSGAPAKSPFGLED